MSTNNLLADRLAAIWNSIDSKLQKRLPRAWPWLKREFQAIAPHLLRALIVIAAICIAFACAARLTRWLLDSLDNPDRFSAWLRGILGMQEHSWPDAESFRRGLFAGVAALGVVTILATFQDFLKETLPKFANFVGAKAGGWQDLSVAFGLSVAILLGAFVSVRGLATASEARDRSGDVYLRLYSQTPPWGPGLKYYVFFGDEADGQAIRQFEAGRKGDPATCDEARIPEQGDCAVRIDKGTRELLSRLVRSLAACAESADDPVVLSVQGFASTSEWEELAMNNGYAAFVDRELQKVSRDYDIDTLKAFNWWVSKERRREVIAHLQSLVSKSDAKGPGMFVVCSEDQSNSDSIAHCSQLSRMPQSYAKMRANLGFRDASLAGYSEERGLFTRRAEVTIDHIGGCSVPP